ncbi:MAG: universal stress protein [Luteolibacter sp.]
MKTIVAAVDFSNSTPGVIEMAVSMARKFHSALHLFHTVEPQPAYTAYGFTPEEFPAMNVYQDEALRRAKRHMEHLHSKVAAELPEVTSELVEGSPLHQLSEYVKENGADLVVMGSHGHGVVASLLLGSVAEGMVRKAKVPVLIIPAEKE